MATAAPTKKDAKKPKPGEKKGGVEGALTRKFGGVPAYVLLIGVGVPIYLYRKSHAGTPPAVTATAAAPTPSGYPSGLDSGGGGGGAPSPLTPDPTTTDVRTVDPEPGAVTPALVVAVPPEAPTPGPAGGGPPPGGGSPTPVTTLVGSTPTARIASTATVIPASIAGAPITKAQSEAYVAPVGQIASHYGESTASAAKAQSAAATAQAPKAAAGKVTNVGITSANVEQHRSTVKGATPR